MTSAVLQSRNEAHWATDRPTFPTRRIYRTNPSPSRNFVDRNPVPIPNFSNSYRSPNPSPHFDHRNPSPNFVDFEPYSNPNPSPNLIVVPKPISRTDSGEFPGRCFRRSHEPPPAAAAAVYAPPPEAEQPEEVAGRYVTFRLGSFSKRELKQLRIRFVSELQEVRTLRNRVESAPRKSDPVSAPPDPYAVPPARPAPNSATPNAPSVPLSLPEPHSTPPSRPKPHSAPPSRQNPPEAPPSRPTRNSAPTLRPRHKEKKQRTPVFSPKVNPKRTKTVPSPKVNPKRTKTILSPKVGQEPKRGAILGPAETPLLTPEVNTKQTKPVSSPKVDQTPGRAVALGPAEAKLRAGIMRKCGQILAKLMSHEHGWVFNEPVDAKAMNLYDYHTVIKKPMDLGTVKTKLRKKEYASPLDFFADVKLTFDNALMYNAKGTDVYAMAKQLLTLFESNFGSEYQKFDEEHRLLQIQQVQPTPMQMAASVVGKESEKAVVKKPVMVKFKAREMNFEEKQKLAAKLESLPFGPDGMDKIIEIVKRANGKGPRETESEVELDVDVLDNETLWELSKFVASYDRKVGGTKKMEVSRIKKQSPVRAILPYEDNSKIADETDVDIVDIGDELPLIDYPRVVIEKDAEDVPGGSPSSNSSSSDSYSSSDADSDSDSSRQDSDVDNDQST